ncbi:MAG TPA: MarR family transcriptional regulator [Bacillota bacterium]|nr:MarR family transcriptional regulator [Bacillota bacterium]
MDQGDLNRLLARVSRVHYRRSFAEFAKFGITQGQPRILNFLVRNDGCIQRELCDSCHLEPATVTKLMANMEKAGLIERRNEPGNRKNLCVFLTAKGREAQQCVERVHAQIEQECFAGFSVAEKEQAAQLLQRIGDNLIKAEGKTES